VDVFSYGIILCEITARVHADPEILPRTKKFGVDYVAFSKMATDCPLHFLHLTFICCQVTVHSSLNSVVVILCSDLPHYSFYTLSRKTRTHQEMR